MESEASKLVLMHKTSLLLVFSNCIDKNTVYDLTKRLRKSIIDFAMFCVDSRHKCIRIKNILIISKNLNTDVQHAAILQREGRLVIMEMTGLPQKQGLYDPRFEHDACGIGFVVNSKGKKSNKILTQALDILLNLDHRGGLGADPETGDGAGILIQIPHEFYAKECATLGFELPSAGKYGVGMLFTSPDPVEQKACQEQLESIIAQEGQILLGWREVPTNSSVPGRIARSAEPRIRQVFIAPNPAMLEKMEKDDLVFERKLYIIRKQAEKLIRRAGMSEYFYFPSLSCRKVVYKGMLTPAQLGAFYLDLQDPSVTTAIAMVHSRFSTNTFPNWERAHPYRFVMHNGEINTLRGNINWMKAREAMCQSEIFNGDMHKLLPIVDENGSDSGMFDNCLEFLSLTGRSLPHAMMMMVPEPWSKHESMSDAKKAFYEYHSCMMEPWDGPAAMGFTDGRMVGAVLDRNGLRPARYYIMKDDTVVLASEVGVLDIPPEKVLRKERLRPGRMLLVDTVAGEIYSDDQVKTPIASEKPYRQWLDQYMINLDNMPSGTLPDSFSKEDLIRYQQAFGYTYEDLHKMIVPLAQEGVDPVGAMGNDIPLAVLSNKSQLLYNYFKQLFAQVTNPPIDALREEIFTDTGITIGPEKNLLEPAPDSCRQVKMDQPIISDEELSKIKHLNYGFFRSITFSILYDVHKGKEGMEEALAKLGRDADRAIQEGYNLFVLSDRGIDENKAAIPALLAVSSLHHRMIKNQTRLKTSLILESAEPREVHHFAMLVGYGVSGINPYLVFQTLDDLVERGLLTDITSEKAKKNYIKAVTKGLAKILSKMGISTVQGYQGAQIFEAVGIHKDVIDRYFTGTPSRIGGIGLAEIADESAARHERAFSVQSGLDDSLETGSYYQWRHQGEKHMFNPQSVVMLQQACRNNDYKLFCEYTKLMDNTVDEPYVLRNLLNFKGKRKSVPIDEVETIASICKRFKTGAMSFGSISKEAHECMAIAMNRIGGKSNTGEGGEDPDRFTPDANGDLRRSAIKQVASGRFGVSSHYLVNADEIQIKMAQGAKPGEGGQLPGRKVYPWVAKVRNTTAGVGLISPPPHHDIYSIEDLSELIHDLKNANPHARISVKLVSEIGVGTIAAGVAKARADVILISGYDGGTGASPRTSIRHAGLPWELGLAETHQTLLLNGLRDRVVVETDGKLMTGRDVVVAALLGAEEFGFATAPLVVLGCVMMRVCNLDTCPVGVATQNPELRKLFAGKPEYVVNFMTFIAQQVREIMAELGFRTINEMIGQTQVLESIVDDSHGKAAKLDLSNLLYQPPVAASIGRYCSQKQDHRLEQSLDMTKLLPICQPALEKGSPVTAHLQVHNTNRVVGTILGSEITRKYGATGLPDDTIRLYFNGSAGQSFGAFLPHGVTMTLSGDTNDHLGKGLSGGKLIVAPPPGSFFPANKNVITGNVALYGAISGEVYIRGVAGERFAVRNSGANAVVEGVGDNGCEYMTGGKVVILGRTGRNFAAGMSGGIAYVYDESGYFPRRCNTQMVMLEKLEEAEEIEALRQMIEKHQMLTQSTVAAQMLGDWENAQNHFVRVIPKDYKRMIRYISDFRKQGLNEEEAIMAAFEENKNDQSRVGGN